MARSVVSDVVLATMIAPSPGGGAPQHTERHAVALADTTSGFNYIGSHAVQLRGFMTAAEAEAFYAIIEDVMAALLALPEISLKRPQGSDLVQPRRARPDRLPQGAPNLNALDRFFTRLLDRANNASDRKLLLSSRAAARRALRGFSELQPLVSARGR